LIGKQRKETQIPFGDDNQKSNGECVVAA
jgi:hypothetical protein